MDLQRIFQQANSSSFYRILLNWTLGQMIPFNKPHGFKIVEVEKYRLKISLPYKKRNLNHIKGLHACAMATVSEYTTGLLLISNLDAKKYRLIMQRMEMDYHYQGKLDATAEFQLSQQWMEDNIYTPLRDNDSVIVPCEIKIHDVKGNHLSTGKVFWQVKDWHKVKTKVAS